MMESVALPEQLACPAYWHYSKVWEQEFVQILPLSQLSSMCHHSEAGFRIIWYISTDGERALTKVKKQNLFIKRLSENTISWETISHSDVDGLNDSAWEDLIKKREELGVLYNVELALPEVLKMIDEVAAFINAGAAHGKLLHEYITVTKAAYDKEAARKYREARSQNPAYQALEAARSGRKWDAVEINHSKATDGFIYILSNALMPGVYKVGFTAGNPDRRAKEITSQHKLPVPFEVLSYWRTKDPFIIEQRIHDALSEFRKAGEFFQVEFNIAKETIESLVINNDQTPSLF